LLAHQIRTANQTPTNALTKTTTLRQVPGGGVVETVNHAATNAAVSMP